MGLSATVEIEITPPGPERTRSWWTVRWDGTSAVVRTAPGLKGEEPADWGIHCTSATHTDVWRDEGGTPYVVEQILDGFGGAGAKARIVALDGPPKARAETLASLRAFAEEHPECAAELRRLTLQEAQ